MTVIDIVSEYLRTNKYDGLCLPKHGCACLLEDLAPCAAVSGKCRPGHRVNVSAATPCWCEECGFDHWHIEAEDASELVSEDECSEAAGQKEKGSDHE